MQKWKKAIELWVLAVAVMGLISCSATAAMIHHSDLTVESKMSTSVFLDPLELGNKTIYVQVRNTSSENLNNLTSTLKNYLKNGGYTVVDKPQMAHDLLQVNVLQYGAVKDPDEVWKSLYNGYGAVLTGGLAGVGVGVLSGNAALGVGAGVGVTAASWIANETIQDKAYSLITDVKLSVQNPDKSWKKHETRVASVADQVNLKFAEAKPVLVEQLAKEISGIFVSSNQL